MKEAAKPQKRPVWFIDAENSEGTPIGYHLVVFFTLDDPKFDTIGKIVIVPNGEDGLVDTYFIEKEDNKKEQP